jgi:KDO2-lipid IV(A) lauroyltransferase
MITGKLLYLAMLLVSLLPMRILYLISDCVYFVGYRVFKYREKVVIQNLSRAFPEMNYGEIRCVCRKFYHSFADFFAEIVKLLSITPAGARVKMVLENPDVLNSLIDRHKTIIACTGHCGNWEMLNLIPQMLRYDVFAVYKPLRSKTTDYLIRRLRTRFGMKLVPARSIAKHLLSRTSEPALYLFLADQCPETVSERSRLVFLNQQTGVLAGVEKLARATGSAVVYLNISQTSRGHYCATCIPVCLEPEFTSDMDITKTYFRLLEDNIKKSPSGWLWSHRRWKR